MNKTALCILIAAFCRTAVAACGVPDAALCLPSANLTELTGCVAMCNRESLCEGKSTQEEKLECACTQELLDSYFKINAWHAACDARMGTSSVTTPASPTITTTYDVNDCFRLDASCRSGDDETNKCSNTWMPSSSLSYVSCICQPPIYSLMSECQYNGNISCKRTSAYESNILGYSVCSYFWSGSETLSSIDLTSFIGITPTGAENQPGVQTAPRTTTPSFSDDWISSFISLATPIATPNADQIPING